MKTFLFGNAKGNAMIVARIAIMMALTVLAQYLSGLAGIQLLTGSIVNLFLILSAMLTGIIGGIAVGVVTPFIALLIGLNPNIVLVPFIALSNALYVALFGLACHLAKLPYVRKPLNRIVIEACGVAIGAVVKFLFMYLICLKLVFPLFLADKMLTKLAAVWGVMQLFTALIGGAVACAVSVGLDKLHLTPYEIKQQPQQVNQQENG